MAGAVRVDGRAPRRPAFRLRSGSRIEAEVRLDRVAAAEAPPAPARWDALRVLYEDDWLIAVDKPPGLPTHATVDAARPHLAAAVRAHLSRTRSAASGEGDAPYLGLHQRLDRDTSGVLLFAKDPAANAALAEQFARREIEKVYQALTIRPAGPPPGAWTVEDRLARVGTGRQARMARVSEGGATACTDFRVVEALPGALLVEARPRTGRKHQIRVHLADAGLPILGDVAYGGPPAARVMLHALRLALRHPITGAPLTIASAAPASFRPPSEGRGFRPLQPARTRRR